MTQATMRQMALAGSTAAAFLMGSAVANAASVQNWEGSFTFVGRETEKVPAKIEILSDGRDVTGTLDLGGGPLAGTWELQSREQTDYCRFDVKREGVRLIIHGDCSESGYSGLFTYEGAARGTGDFEMTGYRTDIEAGASGQTAVQDGVSPPPGRYVCWSNYASTAINANATMQRMLQGSFTLSADGRYRWMENGPEGTWSHDASNGSLAWIGGMMEELGALESTYDPDRGIRIQMEKGSRWLCQTGG